MGFQLSLHYELIVKFSLVKLVNTWHITGKKFDCLVSPVYLALSCLKMRNWPDNLPMTDRNSFCSCYVTMQINFDFSINKYRTAVDQF